MLPFSPPTMARFAGDYLKYKERPTAAAKMTRRAWCPPLFAQHDAPTDDADSCPTDGGGGALPSLAELRRRSGARGGGSGRGLRTGIDEDEDYEMGAGGGGKEEERPLMEAIDPEPMAGDDGAKMQEVEELQRVLSALAAEVDLDAEAEALRQVAGS